MVTRQSLKVEEIFGDLPTLESKRLILRKVTPEDAADMHAYSSDPEVVHHLPLVLTPTLEDAARSIAGFMEMYAARRVAPWGITHKESGRHIGLVGFESWNPITDRAEIGFLISKDYWRHGLASEAAKRVMRFGFDVMRLNRVEARVTPENKASQQLLVKLGMQYEGYLREHSYWRDSYHDLLLYAILRREFEG